jgi:hypothetical protein
VHEKFMIQEQIFFSFLRQTDEVSWFSRLGHRIGGTLSKVKEVEMHGCGALSAQPSLKEDKP